MKFSLATITLCLSIVIGANGCTDEQFQCLTTDQCVDKVWTCDGEDDCGDNSDEDNCGQCQNGAMKCHKTDRTCVARNLICNGENDCENGKDERNCRSCRYNAFRCSYGSRCISMSKRCDGYEDCTDGSDEESCSHNGDDRSGLPDLSYQNNPSIQVPIPGIG